MCTANNKETATSDSTWKKSIKKSSKWLKPLLTSSEPGVRWGPASCLRCRFSAREIKKSIRQEHWNSLHRRNPAKYFQRTTLHIIQVWMRTPLTEEKAHPLFKRAEKFTFTSFTWYILPLIPVDSSGFTIDAKKNHYSQEEKYLQFHWRFKETD